MFLDWHYFFKVASWQFEYGMIINLQKACKFLEKGQHITVSFIFYVKFIFKKGVFWKPPHWCIEAGHAIIWFLKNPLVNSNKCCSHHHGLFVLLPSAGSHIFPHAGALATGSFHKWFQNDLYCSMWCISYFKQVSSHCRLIVIPYWCYELTLKFKNVEVCCRKQLVYMHFKGYYRVFGCTCKTTCIVSNSEKEDMSSC